MNICMSQNKENENNAVHNKTTSPSFLWVNNSNKRVDWIIGMRCVQELFFGLTAKRTLLDYHGDTSKLNLIILRFYLPPGSLQQNLKGFLPQIFWKSSASIDASLFNSFIFLLWTLNSKCLDVKLYLLLVLFETIFIVRLYSPAQG